MSAPVEWLSNNASEAEIAEHLSRCDADFVPPLSSRVEINDYARKIASKATRFEAWSRGTLVGLVVAYCNDQETHVAFITSVSVLHEWTRKGIAARLIDRCIEHAKASGMLQISLEVARHNKQAIRLYEESGFVANEANAQFVGMTRYLKSGEHHEQQA